MSSHKIIFISLVFFFVFSCVGIFAASSLNIGIIGSLTPEKDRDSYKPLVEYLQKELGIKIKLRVYPTYSDLLHEIGNKDTGNLDMAVMSPVIAALVSDVDWIEFLATIVHDGKIFFRSMIITKKNSPIKRIRDLRKKKIGFTNPFSASGFIYPTKYLKDKGLFIKGKPLYKTCFFQIHEASVRALLMGKVDAIATYDHFFKRKARAGEFKNLSLSSFRVLAEIPDQIPMDVIICRKSIGPDLIKNLKIAFEEFKNKSGFNKNKEVFWYEDFLLNNREAYVKVNSFLKSIVKD
ncbi:phosphate/phosphite/phosphonate ABC transporter substrate-binding protein [bacterium]|nr:phosphate/phosphite/phosphonate ABC transporter substrate-binding protein [bacterium]